MARIRKTNMDGKTNAKKISWNIALYIRLSKDDGNDESLSVTNQRKILMEYVEDFFQGEYSIVGQYIDDGRSGTDYDRPDFQHMMHDMEEGKVNCMICKNLARAFRNYSDQGYFLENFFPVHNIRFITLGDPKIDTYLNPEVVSGMEVPINGLMNDRFAYATSSSVRRTFDTKRRNGEFIGAFAPYGYAKDPNDKNSLVIDEEAAAVVRDIFQYYVYGDGTSGESMSKQGIARRLNEMGIPNPTLYKIRKGKRYRNSNGENNDGLWMGTSITRVLENKVYIGTMVQGRQRIISYKVHDSIHVPEEEWYQVPDTHEAIISKELFEKAAEIGAKDTRTAPGRKETYLFAGFLKCADCGKAMTRRRAKAYVYYTCSTYKRKSIEKCTKHSMRLDRLEQVVLEVIQNQIELADSLKEIVKRINQAPTVEMKSVRLVNLLMLRKQELAKVGDFISNLYIDWKNDDMTREQYLKMKGKFEQQEVQLKDTVEHIMEEIGVMEEGISVNDPYLEGFLKHRNITKLSQGLLVELVKTIFIHENGEITIQFKLEDRYRRIVDFIENNKYTLTVVENMVG